MRPSLRLKVALALFVAAIVLLAAQAVGVRALAETQEERLIDAIIQDDMHDLLRSWRADPALLPPLDPQLHLRLSRERGVQPRLPASIAALPIGVHEIMADGHEVHVAVTLFKGERVYRVYDFGGYERHFKDSLNMLLAASALFVLPAIWLAHALSGFLVRQVAGLAQQVRALRSGAASAIDSRRYDEGEVAELAEAINDYQRRMAAMVARESEFAANVSHELRTPLTAIRTSCELLEPVAALDAKSRRRLQQIERAAADMHALIDCLLALAREDASHRIVRVSLAAVVDAAFERFADRPERGAIRCVNMVPAGVRVQADASALGIVLSNLVDNALRHTQAGAIRVSYEDGTLYLADTGSGIGPDALPHVFERHYRAGSGDTHGLGIGLAIVKRICDRYGWRIGVESGPGTGTRVMLSLETHGDRAFHGQIAAPRARRDA